MKFFSSHETIGIPKSLIYAYSFSNFADFQHRDGKQYEVLKIYHDYLTEYKHFVVYVLNKINYVISWFLV